MIAHLQGTVLEAHPLLVVIDAGGVGYEVHIPITTAERIAGVGKSCSLFIHSVYREDSATLYGFATREDRDFFRLLVEKVSGIGPKIGIAILSRMSVELLRSAIARADIALLSKCPGIGKKTAERLVIELKDKVFPSSGGSAPSSSPGGTDGTNAPAPSTEGSAESNYHDAVASLMTLGYKPADADKFVRKAASELGNEASTEALIRMALSS